jgi:outer membrane receptor protein involved in Fe transport
VFGAFTGFEEDGWRDHSPSRVRSAFGKVGQQLGGLEWDLALTYARTKLIGNGLLSESLLRARREQIYTRPDRTRNELVMATLNTSYALNETDRVSAVVYQRRNRTGTLNGDLNEDFDDAPDPPGVENRTRARQTGEGVTLQWSHLTARHQSTIGAAYERSRSRFVQTEAEGDLDSTRAVVPTEAAETDAQLRGRTRTASVYLTHTYSLLENLQLTVSARYNVTRVQTIDELNGAALPNLNADYTYRKLNPALGATWQVTRALGFYANVSQGSRAPSPIELGCADPTQPCTLPNALQSDPFLKQVVARTLEAGARGTLPIAAARWNAAIFQAENRDDILFVGTSASASRGFFQNFGKTRRRGVELGLSGRSGPFELQTSYSFVRASFQSAACVVSESNSTAGTAPGCAAEQIQVSPGNRIPGIPEHSFKLNAAARPADKWSVGSTLTAYSEQYVRGNENNAHQPGGAFGGSGRLSGYALVDLHTTYDLGGSWQLFAKVTNVFDKGYASAGQLGRSAFDGAGRFIPDADDWRNEQFVGPGAPRAGWIGVRYRIRGR